MIIFSLFLILFNSQLSRHLENVAIKTCSTMKPDDDDTFVHFEI